MKYSHFSVNTCDLGVGWYKGTLMDIIWRAKLILIGRPKKIMK